jgi:hypothetical protein
MKRTAALLHEEAHNFYNQRRWMTAAEKLAQRQAEVNNEEVMRNDQRNKPAGASSFVSEESLPCNSLALSQPIHLPLEAAFPITFDPFLPNDSRGFIPLERHVVDIVSMDGDNFCLSAAIATATGCRSFVSPTHIIKQQVEPVPKAVRLFLRRSALEMRPVDVGACGLARALNASVGTFLIWAALKKPCKWRHVILFFAGQRLLLDRHGKGRILPRPVESWLANDVIEDLGYSRRVEVYELLVHKGAALLLQSGAALCAGCGQLDATALMGPSLDGRTTVHEGCRKPRLVMYKEQFLPKGIQLPPVGNDVLVEFRGKLFKAIVKELTPEAVTLTYVGFPGVDEVIPTCDIAERISME